MAKLRPDDSGEIIFDADDSPIGLTQAFSSVDDDDEGFDLFGYDDEDAFNDPFGEDDEPVSWDYNNKWAGFDWNAPIDGEAVADIEAEEAEEVVDEEIDIEDVVEDALEDAADEAEDALQGVEEAIDAVEDAVEEAIDETADAIEEAFDEFEEFFEGPEGDVDEDAADEAAGDEDVADEEAEDTDAEADQVEGVEDAAEADADLDDEDDEGEDDEPIVHARHGRHAAVPVDDDDDDDDDDAAEAGTHAGVDPVGTHKPAMTERMRKSRRTRRILLVVLVLLALAVVGVGYYAYQLFSESAIRAEQQAQEQASAAAEQTDIAGAAGNDAVQTASHTVDVPNLAQLIGASQEDAIEMLQHGAMVSNTRTVDEKGSAIVSSVTVTLTSDPVDSRTGSPTVYLGINEDGVIVQAGYTASAGALGFGTLSFRDAVDNEHVIEKTLQEAGISVPEGAAVLPADSSEFSTYASDGKTLVRERCSFEGETDVNGTACTWSAVLSYDYTTMNLTGNMNDTVRVIYAYVTSPDAIAPEEPEEDDDEEE